MRSFSIKYSLVEITIVRNFEKNWKSRLVEQPQFLQQIWFQFHFRVRLLKSSKLNWFQSFMRRLSGIIRDTSFLGENWTHKFYRRETLRQMRFAKKWNKVSCQNYEGEMHLQKNENCTPWKLNSWIQARNEKSGRMKRNCKTIVTFIKNWSSSAGI